MSPTNLSSLLALGPGFISKDPRLNTDFHADWYWVNAFDKFVFVNDWEVKIISLNPALFSNQSGNYPSLNSQLQKR